MIKEFVKSANRPWEISAMIKLKVASINKKTSKLSLADIAAGEATDLTFCYAALNKVSRSFAAVIQQLPRELRDPVCLFYLVLRGLDSVEDDATYPDALKIPLLQEFHTKNWLSDWKLQGVGDSADYRTLLANYDRVARSFQALDRPSQSVIDDICKQMGEGMAEFVNRPIESMEDFDRYCYYVAGLVGIGLSELFTCAGIEDDTLKNRPDLSISMGLFLQKTNIIRDYHEDLFLDRVFWPTEVWSKYGDTLDEFSRKPQAPASLACLNELVTDALRHAMDSLSYLRELRDEQVFRFCAIPQAMAIATLEKVYNNPNVFVENVKIRKGLAAMMLIEMNDYDTAARYFNYFAKSMVGKIDRRDPNADLTRERLQAIMDVCKTRRLYAVGAN